MSGKVPSWLGITDDGVTSAGIKTGFMGYAALTGSNTTITNSNCTAASIILITPVNTATGVNMPTVNTVTAGSFTVLCANSGGGRPAGVNYLICS